MARVKTSPKIKKAQNSECEVVLEMAGKMYSAGGATTFEALSNLPTDYTEVKTKGTLKLSKGGKRSERFFYLRPLRRIMASRLRKAQVAKDLEYLLK